jgi:serine O-acetyltransferase
MSKWSAYVEQLAATRSTLELPRPLRALAEEVALCALSLLFPQFTRDVRTTARDVRGEASALQTLLTGAVGLLVPADEVAAVVAAFLEGLPRVHDLLEDDARAILAGDPAAESLEEVILAYPGFLSTAVYRFAHLLYQLEVPVFPRLLSEWAHRETGIDIHPGATIGRSFAIDHGTGVVIGETSVIGDRVKVYQGVTLGALAVGKHLANKKRHPTIGDEVVIYANATILGGSTIVGDGSIIGGNVWLTHSVPPHSVVQFSSRVEQRNVSDDGLEFHI